MHWVYWLILVLAGAWLVASLAASWVLKKEDEREREGLWTWVLKHKAIAGSIAVVYLSAAGLVHETQFYERLGLSAMRYVDPASLAYSILGHWQLALGAGVGALAALLVVMSAWRRIEAGSTWGGRLQEHVQNRDWTHVALWFLALPAKSAGVVRTVLVVGVTISFVAVPLAAAVVVADRAYGSIGKDATGTLRLSQPAKSASGVKHVASTSTHMILVYQCGPVSLGGTPEWREAFVGAFERVRDAFGTLLNGESPSPAPLGPWRPIIVPWSSVSSFDLDDSSSPTDGDGETQDGTEDHDEAEDCTPPWKLDPSPGGRGPAGPPGDSVSIQYSREGRADAEWFDKPTQNVRYLRFRIGGGEWEPPEGIRIAGSSELWYGVTFRGFRLSTDVEEQLAIETDLPSVGSPIESDACRVEVAGCASKTPFVRACAAASEDSCTPCRAGESQADGSCQLMLARLDEEGRVAGYHSGSGAIESRDDLPCSDATQECVERINGILNCGAANLRALATVAGLGSLEFSTVLGQYDLSLPDVRNPPEASILGLHVDACTVVRDRDLHGIATVRAAKQTPGLSQCWKPSHSWLNHSAIIRLVGDDAGTFGGCLHADGSRSETLKLTLNAGPARQLNRSWF